MLTVLLASACGFLERSEVVRAEDLALDGHAYDAYLRRVGDAHLDLKAEVVRRQAFRKDPNLYLRGTGTLRIGDRQYRIVLPDTSPSFLSDSHGYCQSYFAGGGQTAFLEDEQVAIDLMVSEALDAAYGLIQLEPGPGSRVTSYGYSGVCFDDEGKTNVEIFRIDVPSFVAFTLGPQASPLEKLKEYRDRVTP